jgi:hypothetical protein
VASTGSHKLKRYDLAIGFVGERSKEHFASWGDGWGWAWFDAGAPLTPSSSSPFPPPSRAEAGQCQRTTE